MTDERKGCPMRHENGNCLPCGGFCLAVNDEICRALHNAYSHGYSDCVNSLWDVSTFGSVEDERNPIYGKTNR